MAYNENIPQPSDRLKDSQADLLANFQALKQLIDVNHSTFGAATEGKHFKVSMPVQAPAATFLAGETGLYTFLNATTGFNELYVKKNNGTADTPITAFRNNGLDGFFYLPCGLLVKWGTVNVPVAGNNLVNLPTPNYTTAIFQIIACAAQGTLGIVSAQGSSLTQISITCSVPNLNARYLTIGI